MRRISSRRPSPALVISMIALFVAIGGTAFAAIGQNTIGTKQVKPNSLNSGDVKNDSLRGADILESSLVLPSTAIAADTIGSSEVKADSLTAGDLAANSVGASELGSLTVRDVTITIPANTTNSGTAACLDTEQLISGGGNFVTSPPPTGAALDSSTPVGNTWVARARNPTATPTDFKVRALCLGP